MYAENSLRRLDVIQLAALESMGSICELAPGLWLVRTRFSAGVIRNTLSQTLERGDRFVVIDATRDRVAWFNLGPENRRQNQRRLERPAAR